MEDFLDEIALGKTLKMNKLRIVMEQWKSEANYYGVIAIGNIRSTEMTLCTRRPGLFIGEGGKLLRKYFAKIQEIPQFSEIESIHWVELEDIIL